MLYSATCFVFFFLMIRLPPRSKRTDTLFPSRRSSDLVNTEQARWLANRENAADLVGGVELQGKDSDLATVLLDLSQNATMEASFDVGTRILHSMGGINTLQRHEIGRAHV